MSSTSNTATTARVRGTNCAAAGRVHCACFPNTSLLAPGPGGHAPAIDAATGRLLTRSDVEASRTTPQTLEPCHLGAVR